MVPRIRPRQLRPPRRRRQDPSRRTSPFPLRERLLRGEVQGDVKRRAGRPGARPRSQNICAASSNPSPVSLPRLVPSRLSPSAESDAAQRWKAAKSRAAHRWEANRGGAGIRKSRWSMNPCSVPSPIFFLPRINGGQGRQQPSDVTLPVALLLLPSVEALAGTKAADQDSALTAAQIPRSPGADGDGVIRAQFVYATREGAVVVPAARRNVPILSSSLRPVYSPQAPRQR